MWPRVANLNSLSTSLWHRYKRGPISIDTAARWIEERSSSVVIFIYSHSNRLIDATRRNKNVTPTCEKCHINKIKSVLLPQLPLWYAWTPPLDKTKAQVIDRLLRCNRRGALDLIQLWNGSTVLVGQTGGGLGLIGQHICVLYCLREWTAKWFVGRKVTLADSRLAIECADL